MALHKLIRYKRPFWQTWLLHTFLIWLGLMLYDQLTYLYQVQTSGYFIFLEDGSPYTSWQKFVGHNYYDLIWLDIAFFVLLAEANYHYIFRSKSTKYFILSTLGCGFAFTFYFYMKSVQYKLMNSGFIDQLPFLAAAALLTFLYVLLRDFLHKRMHAAEIQSEKTQAELKTLKAQVNPHFFFNTLNSLYGTALEEQATRTAESIEQLSDMMRYTMNEAQQDKTAIAHELDFIKDYLHLQQLRVPKRPNIDIKTEITYDGTPCFIAPMLLIPFIENAFKYGISMDHTCQVDLQLIIAEKKLHLLVRNTILNEKATAKGHGTGIDNSRKRLQLLYPNKHQLHILKKDVFEIDLRIDLN